MFINLHPSNDFCKISRRAPLHSVHFPSAGNTQKSFPSMEQEYRLLLFFIILVIVIHFRLSPFSLSHSLSFLTHNSKKSWPISEKFRNFNIWLKGLYRTWEWKKKLMKAKQNIIELLFCRVWLYFRYQNQIVLCWSNEC